MKINLRKPGVETMKATYRGHEIEVTREMCAGGWKQIYYSIFRAGNECTSGFTSDTSPVREHMRWMKERVDSELESATPWGKPKTEAGG